MKISISSKTSALLAMATIAAFMQPAARGAASLIARGSLSGTLSDDSGLSGLLENGLPGNQLGGLGSGLAWAGGDTFLAIPDRGPNAVPWNSSFDDTTSFIARFQTMRLDLTPSGGPLPFTVTPTLLDTTLLGAKGSLNYGAVTPSINTPTTSYFSGRSDNFGPGNSLNSLDARFDPEGIRVSPDGMKVFISDEYGPYVYQFNRITGLREKVYNLPGDFAIDHLFSQGATEISGNTSGRVANKGMEGLAISPDGKTLIGFEQSPLIQDGGDGGRANRIVTIDVATGATHQYAYDNKIGSKNFNSSEILALNDHQFLVLERDGKGLGDGSTAAVKQLYMVDLTGAQDITGLHGEAALLAKAPTKTLFLDMRAALNAAGISDAQIPAKLEGIAFGEDVIVGGKIEHTLFVGNDNDFLPTVGGLANPNQWFVFGVTDDDLARVGASYQAESIVENPVPEPTTWMGAGLLAMLAAGRLRSRAAKA